MKCPAPKCKIVLAVHSRMVYCPNCRASMRRYSKLEAHDLIRIKNAQEKRNFRIEFRNDRRAEQPKARQR